MKKHFILLILNILCIISFAQRTVISGKILNSQNDSVEFISLSLKECANLPVVQLSKDNTFRFAFELKNASNWRLKHGKEIIDLFVMPKDSVFLTFDMKDMNSTFSASGIHAAHYNYVREKFLAIKPSHNNPDNTPEQEAKRADSLANIKSAFLQKYITEYPEITPEFILHEQLDIRYKTLNLRVVIPQLYAMNHKIKQEEVPIPKGYYDFFDTVTVNEPHFWASTEYQSFLYRFLQQKYEQIKKYSPKQGKYGNNAELYQFGKILFSDSTKWLVLLRTLENAIRHEINAEVKEAYQDFQQNCPYQYPKQYLAQLWQNVQKLQKGKTAPNFVATDLNGKSVSLADFRGKVVYLDIWTTTCGPCIWYMKHENTKMAKENFKDKDVVFVNVCLENSEENWKTQIERLELQDAGLHLFQKGSLETEIAKSYFVNGFPSTFIIDKNGNIFNASPPASNNPAFGEELEKALQVR